MKKDKIFDKANFVDAKTRGKDSLLDKEIVFDTTVLAPKTTKEEQVGVDEYVKMRFKEKTFDNYEYKEVKEKVEEEVYNYELCEETKDILELWEDIEHSINKLM